MFARAKGMENEPERGIRCTMCFDMRFERTALYAYEHGFSLISSSLGIQDGKIWRKSMTAGFALLHTIPIFSTGLQLAKKWWL
ncbi:hypothetical protein J497_03341 [Acinetobacter baumannii 1121032]|nr:hypothetical protein J497_03341 [Acinetobacter baumannii 1121032]